MPGTCMIYDTARDPTPNGAMTCNRRGDVLCLRVTTPLPSWILVCAHPVVYRTTCLEVACHCIPLYLPCLVCDHTPHAPVTVCNSRRVTAVASL
jgi:hypothetical protein